MWWVWTHSHLCLHVLDQLAEPLCNFSSSPLIFTNFDNTLYQARSPCLQAGSIVRLFPSPHPSPCYSTRGKNDRVQSCWRCEDSGALYIWKSHQLSLVSLSAALLPSHHHSVSPPPPETFSQFFFIHFCSVSSSLSLMTAVWYYRRQCSGWSYYLWCSASR